MGEEEIESTHPAVIVPVLLQIHRSPWMNVQSSEGAQLWLVGDSAVTLSISLGCNIVKHILSATKLAQVIAEQTYVTNPLDYEDFVVNKWETEHWKTVEASPTAKITCTDACTGKAVAARLEGERYSVRRANLKVFERNSNPHR